MNNHEKWVIGAGKYNKEKAILRELEYNQNPKKCLFCFKALPYKLNNRKIDKRQIYCNSVCYALHANKDKRGKPSGTKNKTKLIACIACKTTHEVSIHRAIKDFTCSGCSIKKLREKTERKNITNRERYSLTCVSCLQDFTHQNKTKKTCCDECKTSLLRRAGMKSAHIQSNKKRSRNEILFAEMCLHKFKNIKTNQPMFNGWDADIILEDHKIAILWNGAWHYKKITKKHSLKQVQNRDSLKIKEIINMGYTPYTIKDMGKFNEDFVKNQFDIFIDKFNFK